MKHSTKSISGVSANHYVGVALETLILFLSGAIAIALHAKLRYPMRIPGHHGLEFMAIVVAATMFSRFRHASLISAAGVVTLIATGLISFKDPFAPLTFSLPLIVINLANLSMRNSVKKAVFTALLCGLAYAAIPLSRFILMQTGVYIYGALVTGIAYPVFTHFIFGFGGGLAGYSIFAITKKIRP